MNVFALVNACDTAELGWARGLVRDSSVIDHGTHLREAAPHRNGQMQCSGPRGCIFGQDTAATLAPTIPCAAMRVVVPVLTSPDPATRGPPGLLRTTNKPVPCNLSATQITLEVSTASLECQVTISGATPAIADLPPASGPRGQSGRRVWAPWTPI